MSKRFLILILVLIVAGISFFIFLFYKATSVNKNTTIVDQTISKTEELEAESFDDIFQNAFNNDGSSIENNITPQGVKSDEVCKIEGQIVRKGTIISGGTCVPNVSGR